MKIETSVWHLYLLQHIMTKMSIVCDQPKTQTVLHKNLWNKSGFLEMGIKLTTLVHQLVQVAPPLLPENTCLLQKRMTESVQR